MCTPADFKVREKLLTEVGLVQGFGVTSTPGVVHRTAILVIIEGSGVAHASGVLHYNTSTVVTKTLKIDLPRKTCGEEV